MAKQFSAKDVLLYLFSDCVSWEEDVDGDARDDGTPYAIIHHNIRLSDHHLDELLDMAGMTDRQMMETTLDRLKRHNEDDLRRIKAEHDAAAEGLPPGEAGENVSRP